MKSTQADETDAALRVLSTLAVKGAMQALEQGYRSIGGSQLVVTFAPTNGLVGAIDAGARGDVCIMTEEATGRLLKRGILARSVPIATSLVGLAVKSGEPLPDISSREAFVALLRSGRSIAYSRSGASGVYFADLIERLGVAEEVAVNAVVIPTGFTAEEAASGRADFAIQQMSELKVVPGIDIAGPLPRDLQTPTLFHAAIFSQSPQTENASRFLDYLTSPNAAGVMAEAGLERI